MGFNLPLLNRRRRGSFDPYAVLGFRPDLVFDFDAERYRTSGSTTTFSSAITHSASSRATMVDSDGLLKWRPHNLLRQSEFAASWLSFSASNSNGVITENNSNGPQSVYQGGPTVVQQYTLKARLEANGRDFGVLSIGPASAAWVAATFDLVNGTVSNSGTAGAGVLVSSSIVADGDGWICEITSSGIAATFSYVGMSDTGNRAYTSWGLPYYQGDGTSGVRASKAHLYRSDLGGMVDNPDRGDSYVPTTSAARYLPRRGHHVYNGSAWVNEGLLHESEARVNLFVQSNDFTAATGAWSGTNTGTLANDAEGPDGVATSATTLVDSGATGTGEVFVNELVTGLSTSTAYTVSVFAKADQLSWLGLVTANFTTPADGVSYFNLSSGVVGTAAAGHTLTMEDVGGGWYRCAITFTTDATDTSGNIQIRVADADGDFNVDLDGTSSILIYGAQFEAGSTPSSYIPTSGATVTRAAETLTIPAAKLPWPTPNVIGPDLVDNGEFNTDSDWTKGTGWTISGGQASHVAGSATLLSQTVSLTLGKVYKATCDVVSVSGGSGSLQFRSGGTTTSVTITASEVGTTVEVLYVAEGNTQIAVFAGSGTNITIDNISVREIDPLSVSIQMDGKITYADEGSASEVEFLNWEADSNNLIDLYLSAASTATGRLVYRQKNAGTSDVVETGGDAYSPGILVPFNIASRHGSTFINGAVDGTALGGQGWEYGDTTPVALPDLSSTDINLGLDYMGTIRQFRIWDEDLGDTGIEEASA
jgi:hypothetical protein